MSKKKKIWLCIILATVTVLGCLAYTAISWYGKRSKYYGVIEKFDAYTQTFSDGSIIYTPGSEHIQEDMNRNALYFNNVLLVFTQEDLSDAQLQELAGTVDGTPVGVIRGAVHAVQILVKDSKLSKLEEMAQTLMSQENVLYASSDHPAQIMSASTPEPNRNNDGNEQSPDGDDWWAEAIGAYTAWQYSHLCQPINVGIVDTGFDTDHPDLQGQIIPVSNSDSLTPHSHGTHVAGIIGALDNGLGIRGIADHAKLYCADVWPNDPNQSYHTIAEFLAVVNIMVQNGVRIINNSWGCRIPSEYAYIRNEFGIFSKLNPYIPLNRGYDDWLQQRMEQDLLPTAQACIVLLSQLIEAGYEDVLFVQAAGNGYDNGTAGKGADVRLNGFFSSITPSVFEKLDPALLTKLNTAGITYQTIDERILIVGAVGNSTDEEGNYYTVSSFCYGETIDICAPGSHIYSTVPADEGLYDYKTGTSMAAPIITGSVAYIWSLDPELSVSQVRSILLEGCTVWAIGTGDGSGYTYPMVNLGNSVTKMMEH